MPRQKEGIFSSENAYSDEKVTFSRRKARGPTRRLDFLAGRCVLLQEHGVFSSENACSDEKVTFSRRRARPPTRRLDFLAGTCVLLREDGAFLSFIESNSSLPCRCRKTAHPIRGF